MKTRIPHILGASALALSAGLASADQVILDDLIVDGSICAGLDCVNGESFGFDTLRLKENNLRIKFQDTSNSASFPTNDWQLTANDSSNGGANKFSLDDIDGGRTPFTVEAGARTNALYVESDGDIGVGTNSPVVDLHVKTGNTPTLRLEQDGSSGFTTQTWDVAGNETNFFIRDATNGSQLPFRIRPGADTSSLDIAADNDVFMGLSVTSSYAGDLVVGGAGTKLVDVVSTDNGATQYRMISDSGNRRFVALNGAQTVETQMQFGNTDIKLAGPNINTDLWATIDATGITTQGPTCDPGPCDRTFDPEAFEVPSIEEHASFMWENRYLWAVGPTSPDAPYNLTEKTAGMLHELEVAHIYIEQLNQEIQQMKSDHATQIDMLIDRLDQRDTQ